MASGSVLSFAKIVSWVNATIYYTISMDSMKLVEKAVSAKLMIALMNPLLKSISILSCPVL